MGPSSRLPRHNVVLQFKKDEFDFMARGRGDAAGQLSRDVNAVLPPQAYRMFRSAPCTGGVSACTVQRSQLLSRGGAAVKKKMQLKPFYIDLAITRQCPGRYGRQGNRVAGDAFSLLFWTATAAPGLSAPGAAECRLSQLTSGARRRRWTRATPVPARR
jgi:hypothetical protein